MTSTVCNVCAQLDIENGWEWSLYKLGGFHITIQDLQELTHQCPTDGCKLLLRAVFKCFPDASTTDGIVPCFQPGVFEVGHLGELQMYFKMGGDYPCSTVKDLMKIARCSRSDLASFLAQHTSRRPNLAR